jgi:hypothetical protein
MSVRISLRSNVTGFVAQFKRHSIQRLEQAALRATDRVARDSQREIRAAMTAARLGRLGNAVGAGSDLQKGNGVHRRGADAFSATGWIYTRGRSERTRGAIEAYTEGAEISPRRAQWLWIPNVPTIPSRAGRTKMTPALYNAKGFDQRIGPLVFIRGKNPGEALLIARNVTINRLGLGKARRLPKRGAIGSTRQRVDYVIAFIGIKRTTRMQRVNPQTIIARNAARLGQLVKDFISKGGR